VRIFYFSLPDEHRISCRHPILQGKEVQRTFPEMDIGNHKIAPLGGPIVEPLKEVDRWIVSRGDFVGQPQPAEQPMTTEEFSKFILKPILFPDLQVNTENPRPSLNDDRGLR
jgi:hypothetical protein